MFPIFGQNRTNWLLVLPGWRHWIVVHWCGAFTSLFQTKTSICLELWGQGSLPCPLKFYVAMLITTGTNPDRGSATSWSSRKKLSVSSASDYWHPYRSMGCHQGCWNGGKKWVVELFQLIVSSSPLFIQHPAELLKYVVHGGTRLIGSS